MSDGVSNSPIYPCRDCGQPMELIQQPDSKGGCIPLVTCWQKSCLLRGVTLSVEQYEVLTEEKFESYRQMNMVSRPRYLKDSG